MRVSRAQAISFFVVLSLADVPAQAQSRPPAATESPAAGTPAGGIDAARPIAAAGLNAYNEGKYAEAVARFQEADALYPALQYRVYIARAYRRLGQLASAARAYEAAVRMSLPPGAAPELAAAQSTAAAELDEIRPQIPAVSVEVAPAGVSGAQVIIDGAPAGTPPLDRFQLDPGDHTLTVTAPGFEAVSVSVTMAEGQSARVPVLMRPDAARVAKSTPPPEPAIVPGPGALPRDQGAPAEDSSSPLSHRWRPGAILRADIDPVYGGAVFAPGISFGVLDRFEVVVSGLIGPQIGLEPSARVFLLTGAWKPLFEVAMPVFFADGAHAGLRGAAGVQWDFHRRFGAFAQVGGAYFASPPAGYESAYFLPSLGVQGRL